MRLPIIAPWSFSVVGADYCVAELLLWDLLRQSSNITMLKLLTCIVEFLQSIYIQYSLIELKSPKPGF